MAEIADISSEVKEQLRSLEANGLALLNLQVDDAPSVIVAAITQFVRDKKASREPLAEEDVFALGALLGQQYVRGFDWHWGDVTWDFDTASAAVGVLNHDNSLFMNPIGWVSQVMDSDRGAGFLLNFNLVAANRAPVFEPDSATGLY